MEWVLGAVSSLSPQVDTNSPLALPHTLFNLIITHEIKRHYCFYHFINMKTEIQRTDDHILFQQAPRNIFQRSIYISQPHVCISMYMTYIKYIYMT